jgi:hypothetical protein
MMLALLLAGCLPCHRGIVEQYARTPMANSSGRVIASGEFGGRFYHPASATLYEMTAAAQGLEMRWGGGRLRLEFFIGSRRSGRSYAFLENGYLYQAPVGYYAARHSWDMAPGYQADKSIDLDRPITAECLYCHASGARVKAGTLNNILNWSDLHGVTCERCHGDGAAHAAAPRRTNIINPRRLPPLLRDSVCEQCHLSGEVRLLLPGKALDDFKPGQALSDSVAVYIAAGAPRGIRVNSHAEALSRSRCRQSSPELWCGACHNPHRPAGGFREKCLACHAVDQCPSPKRETGGCIECHMPKARASDGGHTVFTDHAIPRRPPPASFEAVRRTAPADLIPYFRAKLPESVAARNLGLAYAAAAAQYHAPALLEKAWPLLRVAAQARPRDPELYARMAGLLQAAGQTGRAAEFYQLALQLDPNQNLALVNLAGLLEQRGRRQEADRLRERALILNPRQPAVRKALGRSSAGKAANEAW